MGETPVYQIPYPELTDPADVPADLRQIAEDFENKVGIPLDGRMDALEAGVGGFVKIAHVALSADTAAVDFTAIPQTYSHLLIMGGSLRSTAALQVVDLTMKFNGDAGPNYGYQTNTVNANAATAGGATGAGLIALAPIPAATAEFPVLVGGMAVLIPKYTEPTNIKTWMALSFAASFLSSTGGLFMALRAGYWTGAAATNRLTFAPFQGSLRAGSTMTLYGMRGT